MNIDKHCNLCDHAYDYHRVQIKDDVLFIKCNKWMGTMKRDNQGEIISRGCDCNCGFKTQVRLEVKVIEEEKK